jgi:nucleoside-diphosphate-sugar epimerase
MHKCISSNYVGEINAGTGIGTSTFEIASIICKMLQSKSVIDHVSINDYSSNIVMDNGLANKLFSWSPVVDIKSGINRIMENYKL